MTKALRLGSFSLEDVLQLQNSDSWSVQYNPFLNGPGARQGGSFIRNAVAWKGLTKTEDETLDEYFARLAETNEGASDGLSTIASRLNAQNGTYRALEDTSGVYLAKIVRDTAKNGMKGSRTVVLPAPAFVAAQEASDDDVHVEQVGFAENYNELMQSNAQARNRIKVPTVF